MRKETKGQTMKNNKRPYSKNMVLSNPEWVTPLK
jgi:hypothetical protein